MAHLGHLFIISAPSGGGKTSLIRNLTKRMTNLVSSVSFTTRSKRPNEHHGSDYFFITPLEFALMESNGEFFESSVVFDNYYGTSKKMLHDLLAKNKDVILTIDWQGAQKIKTKIAQENSVGNCAITYSTIFILPPSLQSLSSRLSYRGQDNPDDIQKRLNSAKEEIKHYSEYDYLVINDKFNQAIQDLIAIIRTNRLKISRQQYLYKFLIKGLL